MKIALYHKVRTLWKAGGEGLSFPVFLRENAEDDRRLQGNGK